MVVEVWEWVSLLSSQVMDAVDLESHFEKLSCRFTNEMLPPRNPFPF